MNYLAVFPDEVRGEYAYLTGQRASYARTVHTIAPAKIYTVVLLDSGYARGEVLEDEGDTVQLQLSQIKRASQAAPLNLVVGICRPQTVKKVLQAAVSFGVQEITFVGAGLSEKSYFTGKPLTDVEVRQRLILEGVEQTGNPFPPAVKIEDRFRPYVEDILGPSIAAGKERAILADQGGEQNVQLVDNTNGVPITLLIGPEKGWSEFEITLLTEVGCTPYSLGSYMLRVELATVAVLSRIRQYY